MYFKKSGNHYLDLLNLFLDLFTKPKEEDEALSEMCKYLGICVDPSKTEDLCVPICFNRGVQFCVFPDSCNKQNTDLNNIIFASTVAKLINN